MGPADSGHMSGAERETEARHAPKVTQLGKDWTRGLCQSCGTEGSAEKGTGRKRKGGEGNHRQTDGQRDTQTLLSVTLCPPRTPMLKS